MAVRSDRSSYRGLRALMCMRLADMLEISASGSSHKKCLESLVQLVLPIEGVKSRWLKYLWLVLTSCRCAKLGIRRFDTSLCGKINWPRPQCDFIGEAKPRHGPLVFDRSRLDLLDREYEQWGQGESVMSGACGACDATRCVEFRFCWRRLARWDGALRQVRHSDDLNAQERNGRERSLSVGL